MGYLDLPICTEHRHFGLRNFLAIGEHNESHHTFSSGSPHSCWRSGSEGPIYRSKGIGERAGATQGGVDGHLLLWACLVETKPVGDPVEPIGINANNRLLFLAAWQRKCLDG